MITAQFEIVREVYIRDDFCIYGAIPIGENANLIQLNKYRNCTLKTYGTKFKTHNIYTLTVEPTTSKYGVTYEVKSTNLDFDNVESITPELNLMLLKEITTESLAKSINDAYPNFIQLVLTDREDEIDTDNIFGVGKVLKSKYINKIKDKCTSYLLRGALPHCLINEAESKILLGLYDDIESIVHAFNIAPYTLLVEKLNRSFWSVDANKTWVQDLTTPLNDFNRIEHMILAFLSNDEIYGNTYMSAVKLGEEIVNYDSSVVDRVVNVANDSNKIVYDVDKGVIQSRKNYEVEKRVARFIRDRLNSSDELNWDWDKYAKIKDGELTDEQKSALEIFCKNNFMVLQGHAGCGKSSSIMALLQMIEDNGLDYICLSPTGKAAKRLSEQTGRKAHTIHKVCMGDDAQIAQDVVIVDEVSMLSLDVCDMLFSTISNPNVRIVFVGDSGQLPPIGLGRVFRDIINSNIVPITTLTKVFRFDYGGMAMISEQTRRGELPMFPNATTQYGDDFTFIPFESVEQVVDIYLNELKTTPIEDIMLLTPQNKGEYGTLNLNNIIQSRINKIDEEFDDYVTTTINGVKVRFKRGDIVINCKNNYGMKVSMGDETNVMNGQIGKVVKVGVDVDGDKIMVIDFDGEDVIFTEDTFNSLKLGNAITTHKSQGSEAKVVINLTIPQHKHMLSKELTYTSRTRAKCKLIEIGSPEIIDWAQSVNANDVAQTRLCEFLLDTNG